MDFVTRNSYPSIRSGVRAINETMMTINIFTVVTVAFLALTKIARGDTATPCQ